MFELVMGALALLAYIAIEIFIMLLYSEVISWFLQHEDTMDDDDIAFTVRNELAHGRAELVQGVLSQRTNQISKVRRCQADRLDGQLENTHRRHRLAVYT